MIKTVMNTELNEGYIVVQEGRTTRATVIISGVEGKGKATAFTEDHFSPRIGEAIAIARAIKDAGEKLEKTWAERVVTEEDYNKKHAKSG